MNLFPFPVQPDHLLLVLTQGRESEGITELIARLAVKGLNPVPSSNSFPPSAPSQG